MFPLEEGKKKGKEPQSRGEQTGIVSGLSHPERKIDWRQSIPVEQGSTGINATLM